MKQSSLKVSVPEKVPSWIAAFALLGAIGSPAATVSFTFEGTLTTVSDSGGLLPTDLLVGMPFTGSVAYDTSAVADSAPGDPANAYYRFQGPAANDFTLTINLGPHTITVDPSPVLPNEVYVGYGASHQVEYQARYNLFNGARPPGSIVDWHASLVLYDPTATALASDAIPQSPLSLGDFSDPYFYFGASNGADTYTLFGEITTLTPVPEPASTGLIGCGAAAIWLLRRRARH